MQDILICEPSWSNQGLVKGFTTQRQGGYSEGAFESLNLGLNTDDTIDCIKANQEKLTNVFNLPERPSYLKQTHGIEVVINPLPNQIPEADAAIATKPGIVLAIQTADCLPILICDNQGKEIAAIHAGWRSLCAGIIENTLALMQSQKSDLKAWLGPCISETKFEVGPEVVEAFKQSNRYSEEAHSIINNKDHLSLHTLASLILKRLNVSDIEACHYCTYQEKDKFYSYRRDKTTGRMASLLWITS